MTPPRLTDLFRHDGPVWQVAWAHPKFGVILASASYDGKVIIWREENGGWSSIAQHTVHQASVNSISWAPQEYGALLLCASSDGKVSCIEFKDEGKPDSVSFPAHDIGANSVSWAPPTVSGSLVQTSIQGQTPETKRFVSGGCDNNVKIWVFE